MLCNILQDGQNRIILTCENCRCQISVPSLHAFTSEQDRISLGGLSIKALMNKDLYYYFETLCSSSSWRRSESPKCPAISMWHIWLFTRFWICSRVFLDPYFYLRAWLHLQLCHELNSSFLSLRNFFPLVSASVFILEATVSGEIPCFIL